MTTKDECFVPGAAQHGNFICYYDFHPADERLKLIKYDLFALLTSPVVVLDVGCNTGDLTVNFLKGLGSQTHLSTNCLAIDVDPILIQRAQTKTLQNITFECLDVTSDTFKKSVPNYLRQTSKQRFDIITLFSVTMWIHLNHGDSGLMSTLKQLSSMTEYLIVEPQPWKCYRAAQRRMKRANKEPFAHWSTIQFRESVEDDIRLFLTNECKMRLLEETERTAWSRKIMIFGGTYR